MEFMRKQHNNHIEAACYHSQERTTSLPTPHETRHIRIENIVKSYGKFVFWNIFFLSIIPLYQYYGVADETFLFAFKYLSGPIFITLVLFPILFMPVTMEELGIFLLVFASLGYGILTVLLSGGLLLAINCWHPDYEEITISGVVTTTSHSKGDFFVSIVDSNKNNLRLSISVNEFQTLKPGDRYSQLWKVGSLGFTYQERPVFVRLRNKVFENISLIEKRLREIIELWKNDT
jgi:hypothetical protein